MKKYNHLAIESKWQEYWSQGKTFITQDGTKQHAYILDMFPYPSAQGLHVGHPEGYTATDIYSRYLRMNGIKVLHPMGWDAFGLPAENYAIKTGRHPREVTWENIANFKRQIQSLGFSYDWTREVNTADPLYYKWTQWLFLQLYKKGLAYRKEAPVNWCPKDQTVLANEQVVNGSCERCGTAVEQKNMAQWFFKTTAYAEALLSDLDGLDWPEPVIQMQKNWIGKSEGAEVQFKIIPHAGVKKILIGTRNPAKVAMIKKSFPASGIDFLSLNDVIVDDSTLKEGDDFRENARKKAEFYFQKTGLPTLSTDHILWLEKWPKNNGFIIHMRKDANPASERAADEEVITFWQQFLKQVGGQSKANFHYALAYADASGTSEFVSVQRNYILQTERSKTFWPGYPTEALLKDEATGVFKSEQADEVRYQSLVKLLVHEVLPRVLAEPSIEVFTTRLDTIFGVTCLVLAPEHPFVSQYKNKINNPAEVEKYIEQTNRKTELERKADGKEKTGVRLEGVMAINPVNQEKIPVFIADYVLASYGTGAIMAVPAHDERDLAFAKRFGLPIKRVVEPKFIATSGESALQRNKEIVKRNVVCVIMRNPQDDSYLCVSWKNFPMHGFITGGLEEGEDVVAAAKREIYEETGYKNVKLVRNPDFALHSLFYHRVKKENRWARFQYLFFELENEERDPISKKEEALHEIVWKKKEELKDFFSVVEGDFSINFINNQDYIYKDEGILWNSAEFTGLESGAAKEAISAKLTSLGADKPFALIIHGTSSDEKRHWYDWARQKLQNKGYEVAVPNLPDSDLPVMEKWLQALEPYVNKLNARSVIIGHSLGAPAALQFILRSNKIIGKLVLVAPTHADMDFTDIEKTHNAEQVHYIKTATKLPVDWAKVSSLVKQSVVMFSDNDPYIPTNTKDLYERDLNCKIKIYAQRGHFSDTSNSRDIPELLDFIPSAASLLVTKYRLRDWLISRQRYWGAPIPIIYCEQCGIQPVPENDLPVILPEDVDFRPTGESPLARSESFHNITCPKCGIKARRESDTMDTFVDSSWYFLRYTDPQNSDRIFDANKVREWLPVDLYVGGAEHAVLHLLYARFFTKVLADLGYVNFKEPFLKLRNQGLILGEDGQKMSKSRGNVVNPDEIVQEYGADTLRLYEMFMGPLEDAKPWNTSSIIGMRRFLERVWRLADDALENVTIDEETNRQLAKAIKRVSEDITDFKFNTAISALMQYSNYLIELKQVPAGAYQTLLLLLNVFAPHLCAEAWEQKKYPGQVWERPWPKFDEKFLIEQQVVISVQVNGKMRGTITCPAASTEQEVAAKAQTLAGVAKHLSGKEIKRVISSNKFINFVV